MQHHGCIGFLKSFEVWWRWQQPSEGSLYRTSGCRREMASVNSGIRHSSWPRSKWRGRRLDLSLRVSNSLWQTAHISATYGQRFPCSWIWFLLTLVDLRVLITVRTVAIFYVFLLGLICVVLPIVWVSEGYKLCHHQSQINHSSWQAVVCDLCSSDTSNRGGGGSHTNTVYASLCRFMCENWETISKGQFVISITWGSEWLLWHRGWSVNAWMFKQQWRRNIILSMQDIVCKKRMLNFSSYKIC